MAKPLFGLSLVMMAAVLPGAEALTFNVAGLSRHAAAASGYSWAHALANRNVVDDEQQAAPPLPHMELVDAQTLDMEMYDLEMRLADEWQQRLLDGDAYTSEDDDIIHTDDESLMSAFVRS